MLRKADPLLSENESGHSLPASQPIIMDRVSYQTNGHPILHDIDLRLPQSGCTAVMGFNGAGKSVLLRLLHGLIKPTRGSIRWGEITDRKIARRKQAMVFQKPVLLRRSVEANLRYVLKRSGQRGEALRDEIDALLELGHLSNLRSRPATVLSGGEAQRLALIRALACHPEVLFLDEPTASLDPAATLAIEQILASAIDKGIHVVLITQDLPQAKRIGTDVVFLHGGEVVEQNTIEKFIKEPQSVAARAFLDGRLMPVAGIDEESDKK